MGSDSKKIKILFFTPFAGRTGSEMSLQNYITNIDKSKFDVRLFALKKGELLDILQDDIKVYYDISNDTLYSRLILKIRNKLNSQSLLEKQILKLNSEFRPDLWVLNTMIMDNISKIAALNKIPYAVYFHELLSQYGFVDYESLKLMCSQSLFTIACSKSVSENLKTLGSQKILTQYECINTIAIDKADKNIPICISEIKKEGTTIIGMSGQRIDRKGFDLFIKIANELKNEPLHFIWLGASRKSGYEYFLENFILLNRLNNVSLIHPKNNEYYAFLSNIDLFFLSSIEDPFPLVMLEANYLNKFIISFKSGGAEEFIKEDNGLILNSTNIKESAAEILHLIKSKKYLNFCNTSVFQYDAITQTRKLENLLLNNI